MAQQVRITLTKYGNQSLIQQGAYKTFANYSVTDDLLLYDVEAKWKGDPSYLGGTRTLITPAPTCQYASTQHISKRKPSTEQLKKSQQQLEWNVQLSDCDKNYSSLNPTITVNLSGYFNYLESLLGEENYGYSNKFTQYLFDNINVVTSELDASTFTYVKKYTSNSENISYVLDKKSCSTYSDLNAYIMTLQNGDKILQDNTRKLKHWSPFILAFDTVKNQEGSGDILKLLMTPIEWGYVGKLKEVKSDNTYRMSDFVSVKKIETMSEDDVNKTYQSLLPAAKLSYRNATSDLYYLTDTTGIYAESEDMLATLAYRFHNSDKKPLLKGLVEKAKNHIQVAFPEVSTNVFKQTIKFKVANKKVGGVEFEEKQIRGGNVTVELVYDSTDVTVPLYSDVITWS